MSKNNNKKYKIYFKYQKKDIIDIKQSLCPKCNTVLIEKHIQFLKDYCPNCKDGLVYVIDIETGKGKQCFFNDLI